MDTELARRIALGCYGSEPWIEPITRQNHEVYRLHYANNAKILKMGRSDDPSSLRKELMVIDLLHQKGLPVPDVEFADPAGTQHGRPYLIMRSAGERRVIDSMNGPDGLARSLFFEMGTVLARVHGVTFDRPGDIRPEGIVPRDAPALRREVHELADWAADRGYIGRDAAARFRALGLPSIEGVALCHGDFHAVQCVEQNGQITAVVDWESAWSGNSEIDLAVTHAYLDFYCRYELIDRFFVGYVSVRPLPDDYDRASVPVRMAQALGMMRVWDRLGLEPNLMRTIELYRAYSERAE